MEMLRGLVLSDDDEPKPTSSRTRELLRRIVAIVTVTAGMVWIIWDATK